MIRYFIEHPIFQWQYIPVHFDAQNGR